MSSLNEITTDQLGNKVVFCVGVHGVTSPAPTSFYKQAIEDV